RLHDDLDPALPGVAGADALDRRIGDLPPHRLEQRLAAREDDPPRLLSKAAVGKWIVAVEIGHALGQMVGDARHICLRLFHHRGERAADIGAEALLVAMRAAPVAGPGEDVVDGFHGTKQSSENRAAYSPLPLGR